MSLGIRPKSANPFWFAFLVSFFVLANAQADGLQIVLQPQGRAVRVGSDVTLTVQGTNDGTSPIFYRWEFNGTNLYTYSTNSLLTLPQIRLDQLGTYVAFVQDASGEIKSEAATLVLEEIREYVAGWGDYNTALIPPDLKNVVSLAASARHTLALKADGTVVAWGENSHGETNVPPGLSNVVAVSATSYYSQALKADGTVVGWGVGAAPTGLSNVVAISSAGGYTNLAVMSDGTVVVWGMPYSWNPAGNVLSVLPGVTNAVAAALGSSHGLALTAEGTVVSLGPAPYGATEIPFGLNDVVAIAAGGSYFSLALRADGTIAAWGFGAWGQTKVPASLHDAVAIAASAGDGFALTEQGTVVAWGENLRGESTVPPGLSDVVAIGPGTYSCVAAIGRQPPFLASPLLNRTVIAGTPVDFHMQVAGTHPFSYQWRLNGTNLPGATSPTLRLPNPTPGAYSIVVSNAYGVVTSPDAILIPTGILVTSHPTNQQTYGGGSAQFTVKTTGQEPITYQWFFHGEPLSDETNVTLTLSNLKLDQAGPYSVSVSNQFGTATSHDGLLTLVPMFITGQPMSQRVLQGSNPVLSVGVEGVPPFTYQWQYQGTDLPGGTDSVLVLENVEPSQSGEYTVVISNAYGTVHSTLALLSVVPPESWLDGSQVDTNSPIYRENLIAIAEGIEHTVGLRVDRTVIAWGANFSGQTNVPSDLSGVEMIGAGVYHSLALTTNGTVFAWGDNTYGQTNIPPDLIDVTAISAGGYHNLALKSDCTVVGWGENLRHQLDFPAGSTNIVAIAAGGVQSTLLRADGTLLACGASLVPSGLSNIIAIASGGRHELALCADGTVLAWGHDTSGETRVPAELTNVVAISAARSLSMALRADGSVVAWGDYWHTGDTNTPANMTNVIAISAGQQQALALISYGAPHITIQPWDQYVPAGADVALTAKSVGSSLSFQWEFNGASLPGETSDTLIVAKAQPKDSGEYALVVSNSIGATKTRSAKLAVAAAPQPIPPSFVPQSMLWRDDTGFTFAITGEAGSCIEVQFSTDLTNWYTLTQETNTFGQTQITDPTTTSSQRFYRLKQLSGQSPPGL